MEGAPANDTRPRRGILHSYRTKLIASFTAILGLMLTVTLLIQLFGMPYSGYRGIYHQIENENARTLSLGADMAKDRLVSWFDERRGNATVLAENPAIKNAAEKLSRFMGSSGKKGPNLAALRKLPEYADLDQRIRLLFMAHPAYESIQIVDAGTKKIVASTVLNGEGLTVLFDATVTEPVETGKPYINMLQDADKRYWIYFAYPIRSARDRRPVAAAIFKIHAEEAIAPILGIARRVGEGAEVLFANNDLTIFAAMSAKDAGTKPVAQAITTAAPQLPISLGVKGQEGIKKVIDYRGIGVLAAYRHIPISEQDAWGFVIKRRTADIYAETTLLVSYFVAVYLFLAGIFLWVAAGIAKNLAHPIETLAQLARRAGQGESAVRAPAFSGEPGILAENFNAMLTNIEENTRQLKEEIEEHKLTVSQLREAETRAQVIMEELQHKSDMLERSNKELEQFAYVSSHDLQEPLRTITSYVQLLDKRYKSLLDEKADMYINFVTDAARRMQTLINDLLNFSRVGSRGKPFTPVRTEDLVDSLIASQKIQNADVTITRDKLPDIVADEMQMMQVFQNLLVNAVKFHGATSPHIHIGTAEDNKEWTFWVRDNGIGIDPKYFDRIFVVFQRLHTQREYAGTGIGLALVKKVVERHGGRIWVESELGKGATFWFTISKGQHKPEGALT